MSIIRHIVAAVGMSVSVASIPLERSGRAETIHGDEPRPFAQAIAQALPRTVKIYGGTIGREPGYATGIIVSADGQILTASGPLLSGESIRIVLADGSRHQARIVRRSVELSAVLLKIDAATPSFFDLNEAPTVEKGDWVIGVSNAFNVAEGREPPSVTLGIYSLRTALEARRGVQDFSYTGDVLLIDAITSNPGAAGGALVDVDGRLLGMLGKIIESRDTGTRLNYAVPHDLLETFLAGKPLGPTTPQRPGEVELGVRLFAPSGPRAAPYVDHILPNSPAATAGLMPDDLILQVGDERVLTVADFKQILKTLAPGKPVVIRFKRKAGLLSATVVPTARAKEAQP